MARPRDRGGRQPCLIHATQARDLGADTRRDRSSLAFPDHSRRHVMKIERRVLAAALVTIGLTAALQPSPVWAQAAPAPVPMTLISQSNEAGFPLWLAKKLGYFSENGIDATIKSVSYTHL